MKYVTVVRRGVPKSCRNVVFKRSADLDAMVEGSAVEVWPVP